MAHDYTHTFEIHVTGRKFNGELLLDPHQTYTVYDQSPNQGATSTETTAVTTLLTAVSTFFNVFNGLDKIEIKAKFQDDNAKHV